jgi:hypothetical protein
MRQGEHLIEALAEASGEGVGSEIASGSALTVTQHVPS